MDRILVATDLSARSDRAVRRAVTLTREAGAALDVLHVVGEDLADAMLAARMDDARRALRAMVDADGGLAGLDLTVLVEAGPVDRVVPRVARDRGADLVVLGSHRGRGLADLLGTPTLARLLRGALGPVLVAAGRPEPAYRTVAVGWDFSPAGEAAARAARALAPAAAVTIVHAWEPPVGGAPYGMELGAIVPAGLLEGLEQDLAGAAAAMEGRVAHDVAVGPPAHVLMRRASEGADLIAVGRHARSGLARLMLGSTAETVALNASCDVLVAPPA